MPRIPSFSVHAYSKHRHLLIRTLYSADFLLAALFDRPLSTFFCSCQFSLVFLCKSALHRLFFFHPEQNTSPSPQAVPVGAPKSSAAVHSAVFFHPRPIPPCHPSVCRFPAPLLHNPSTQQKVKTAPPGLTWTWAGASWKHHAVYH